MAAGETVLPASESTSPASVVASPKGAGTEAVMLTSAPVAVAPA
jgi:hypothetical protein